MRWLWLISRLLHKGGLSVKTYEAPIFDLLVFSGEVLMASDENEMLLDSFNDLKDLLKF